MKEGWNKVKLGDVFTTINGLWTGKKEPFVKVNVYTMANFTKDSEMKKESSPRDVIASVSQYETRKLVKGDILIEKSGGGPNQPVGRAVFFDIENSENNTFSNFTTRLRLSEDYIGKVDSKFVQQYLKYVYITGGTEQFQNNSTNIRNLQLKEYLGQDLYYPSFAEQQRIVSILDHCFEAIDKAKANAEQNLQNAKELFESYLQEMFTPDVNGWKEKKLKNISRINYGYTEKASFEKIGPKFLRITDIQDNNVNWDTVPYCKCNDKDIQKHQLETGDIVFARTGATTGKSYLINNPPVSVFASYLIRLKVKSKKEFIPEFISYFFHTKTYWDKIKKGTAGAAQGGFNATKLGELKLPYPKSLEKQQEIVEKLDALQAETQQLETIYQKKIDNLEELKQSILQKAFAGELKTEKATEYV